MILDLSAALGLLALAPITVNASPAITKNCIELLVPVPVNATNIEYDIPRVYDTISAVNWAVNVTTWSNKNYTERIIQNITISQTFKIHAKLCVPSVSTSKSSTLQILTAGNGFDKRYWDVSVEPSKYNYIDAAISKGYPVLAYDKLGCGKSDKPDGYTMVQVPSEVEVLASLTRIIRSGKLLSVSNILSNIKSTELLNKFNIKPKKVLQIGHSYGSVLIQALLAKYGDELADGAILTGFLVSSQATVNNVAHFDHDYAAESDPSRFGSYGPGYIVLVKATLQKLFFRGTSAGFEKKLLDYTEKIKQPETVGVYGSEGTLSFTPAAGYSGPVMIMAGEFDYPLCNGDCKGAYQADYTMGLFPAGTNNYTFHLVPETGHALTLAKSAAATAQKMLDYLEENKL
ncbi:Alpha/Beta hydrolase fold [Rhypophila sp. PSN 637]